jgi:hypoxanthine phosphoribosyltransferase
MQSKILSWEDIDIGINELIANLKSHKSIIGITRGGLIPAIIISHKLEIKYGDGDLIIDDIVETGITYNQFKNKGKFITLINKSSIDILSSSYLNSITVNKWVIFPWENQFNALKDYENYKSKRNL